VLTKVAERLWVGDEADCKIARSTQRMFGAWGGIVHACKFPCHAEAVGYDGKAKLEKEHPEYIAAERPGSLYLNIIDPPVPLFRVESFTRALDYIDAHRAAGEQGVLVHCNQGQSRAPSIALLWLAKRGRALPGESFAAARDAFVGTVPRDIWSEAGTLVFPGYRPGAGIEAFLTERWDEIA